MAMKTITTDKMTIGLVEVPDNSIEVGLSYYGQPCVSYRFINLLKKYGHEFGHIKIRPGNYVFLSTTKDITDEVAARIVGVPDKPVKRCVYCSDHGWNNEFMPCGYCNPGGEWKSLGGFSKRLQDYELAIKYSIHNFTGILIANNLDPTKNYAILEIKK